MLRLIIFAVLAYAAYRYAHGWYGVGAVLVAYILFSVIAGMIGSKQRRQKTDSLLHKKMSDEEKAHFSTVGDHQRAMDSHKAQFDPDLRKKLGPQ